MPVFAQEDLRIIGPEDATRTLLVRGSTDIEAFAPVMQEFVNTTINTRIRYEQWGSNALYEKSDDDCHRPEADADLLISSAIDQQVKLVNDGCAMAHRSAELIDAVAEGQFLVAYNVLGSYALARAAIDPRIGVVAPQDYTLILSRGAMIPKGAQQAGNARAFLDFLLSDQGRTVLSQSHLIATFDDNDMADFSSTIGATPVLRPIPLSPTLLVGLDQMKRELFIRQWREKMVLQPGKAE